MRPDRAIDAYAARQYGVFSIQQTKEAGLSSAMVETRVKTGAWIRLAPSVYALASSPPKWERQMAAALLTRPGAIVAAGSAAFLHGFDGFRQGRPTIMIGPNGNARSALATVIRSRHFDDIHRTRILGFETTALGETLISIGRQTPREQLERVLDDLIASGRVDVDVLLDLTARRSGVPGVGRLRRLLTERASDAYEPPVSELERRLHQLLANPRIPSVNRQLPFDFERVRMTVDVYIPRWRLIVEADGRRWHTRVSDFERDRRRDNEAVAHGYVVLRFTHRMLTQEPMQCLDILLTTGAARTK